MSTTNLLVLEPSRPATSAEKSLQQAYAEVLPQLPGKDWVSRLRADAMRSFAANGLPTRRLEAFKYTDLRERLKEAFAPALPREGGPTSADIDTALGPLASLDAHRLVFVDGRFRSELSRSEGLADSAEFMPLAPLLAKAPSWLEGKFAAGRIAEETSLTALNTALMSDGLMLKIKPGQRPAKPVLLLSVRASAAPATVALRHVIAMEAGAGLTLIEAHLALGGAAAKGLSNTLVDVTVADGATLSHIKCALEGERAAHLSRWAVKVMADAAYRGFQLTSATGLARNDITVEMAGTGSKLDLSGAFLARGTSHLDTTLVVDHTVPGCQSRELFKGVLDDKARGVFQGKIIVRPGADQTDGKQMARALMLSEDAEFDSKPELEIYADDVACGHGATAAALDPNLMFYCRSRGIPESEARALLIEAFVGDAIDTIEDEAIRGALMDVARDWLGSYGRE
jgi:Fe-S cluster assembly protein SufD